MSTAEPDHPITTGRNFDEVLRATLVAVLTPALCNVGSAADGQAHRFLPPDTRSEERITNINGRNHHLLHVREALT